MSHPAPPTPAQLPDNIEAYDPKTIAVKLWRLLDDIDTQDDASRSNDAHFRACVYEIQQKRHAILPGSLWGVWLKDTTK